MPSIGEVIHDQTGLGERESQDVIYERYKTQLVGRMCGEITLPWRGRVGSYERSECETGWGDGLSISGTARCGEITSPRPAFASLIRADPPPPGG